MVTWRGGQSVAAGHKLSLSELSLNLLDLFDINVEETFCEAVKPASSFKVVKVEFYVSVVNCNF